MHESQNSKLIRKYIICKIILDMVNRLLFVIKNES